ncbi:polyprenyl synthetase family protein [Candidatus Galacturonibacter soehngenii]|uniref:Polyprenyl synthetase family protein n=1 Tax=Candidatus Galacturonatibacter soehngenii TaxID=2307010 RepID=A0A7V7QJ92_9FIRM|nr:polyprenyl synthetase family protein [Candidatus Galacturonibacter soehngenii]KAB1436081.1 polyprenyl synthetase family protein [Candidatus Galacturonibacter soehngenii]MBA4686178.1 polyprenyl synthetase family protein [Candidatus Galacturonibacter soehngenii]
MINKITLDENIEMLSYEEAISLVKQEVERALVKSPHLIRDYLKHLASSQGKYIRAVSVIVAALDDEGKVHPDAIKAAGAIEIIHLASLVHDDIIDNADLRRGKLTLQKKYGKRTAVICGDYLLSLALKMVSETSDKKRYSQLDLPDYISRLCLGELEQHINNYNLNLSIYQYLKIISGKTAALFEASFFAGAMVLNVSEEQLRKYRQIGYYIGMIFQLSDDCIDFDTTKEVANKPVQSDYEQGVITLPLIHAFKNLNHFKKKAVDEQVTREEINQAVMKTGGLDFTQGLIKKYYNKSIKRLDELMITDDKKEKILLILNKASRI